MKFGIIRERKNPPDKRVVFSPSELVAFKEKYPEASIVVESSNIRAFSDEEYKNSGFEVVENVDDCDVLIGVKEVPIEALIPNKKYFFFSHTIKKQPYNRKLLQAILTKNIDLYDHETIVDEFGNRLIGFGRYAGIVGAYNGFRAYALKNSITDLPKASTLATQEDLINELQKIKLPAIKIVLSGNGKVMRGAKEMLDAMKIKQVSVSEYLNVTYKEAVYCVIDVLDYNKRKDGKVIDNIDFYNNPTEYVSDFMRFAEVSDMFIAGHFYGNNSPYLFTKEEAKQSNFAIKYVVDISCDVNGPVASTIRASTIEEPIYGYDPKTEKEVDYKKDDIIVVMAVDNLPCELPRDASEGFGDMFLERVIPAFFNNDEDEILARALITHKGKLTDRFSYLQNYVDEGK